LINAQESAQLSNTIRSFADKENEQENVVKVKKEKKEEGDEEEEEDDVSPPSFFHPVAGIHSSLVQRRSKRRAFLSAAGPYKRALSARRDLALRSVPFSTT